MKKLLPAFLFVSIYSTVIVAQSKTGSVCVAKIAARTSTEPNMGVGTLPEGNKIQIDNQIVARSSEKSARIGGLSLKKRHFVKIYQDEKLHHSFKFSFGDFQTTKLCLFTKENYHTWQLWELRNSVGCSCGK